MLCSCSMLYGLLVLLLSCKPRTCALGIICSGPYGFSAPLSQPFSAVHSATYMVCSQTHSSRHILAFSGAGKTLAGQASVQFACSESTLLLLHHQNDRQVYDALLQLLKLVCLEPTVRAALLPVPGPRAALALLSSAAYLSNILQAEA
jgi:hypothetical protein